MNKIIILNDRPQPFGEEKTSEILHSKILRIGVELLLKNNVDLSFFNQMWKERPLKKLILENSQD